MDRSVCLLAVLILILIGFPFLIFLAFVLAPFGGHALTFAWPHFWCVLHTLFCCTRLPTRLLCHHLVPTAAQEDLVWAQKLKT
jgi:hypothetical protein